MSGCPPTWPPGNPTWPRAMQRRLRQSSPRRRQQRGAARQLARSRWMRHRQQRGAARRLARSRWMRHRQQRGAVCRLASAPGGGILESNVKVLPPTEQVFNPGTSTLSRSSGGKSSFLGMAWLSLSCLKSLAMASSFASITL